ncbi:hypothetical protein M0R36_05495 [bacterium]|jgi:hypothetical protein|nr:hypothetical protein [bacterium]
MRVVFFFICLFCIINVCESDVINTKYYRFILPDNLDIVYSKPDIITKEEEETGAFIKDSKEGFIDIVWRSGRDEIAFRLESMPAMKASLEDLKSVVQLIYDKDKDPNICEIDLFELKDINLGVFKGFEIKKVGKPIGLNQPKHASVDFCITDGELVWMGSLYRIGKPLLPGGGDLSIANFILENARRKSKY